MAVTLLVPLIAAPLPFDAVGDLLAVVYLLLLGTFFLALAGLDPGTAFGGMGASREMTVAAIAEPTIALAIFGLAARRGSTNLGRIVSADTGASWRGASIPAICWPSRRFSSSHWLKQGACRWTIPATHLELTMIHEAMILEYSGRYLALIEWAAWLKLLIFFSLLANLFHALGSGADTHPRGAGNCGRDAHSSNWRYWAVVVALVETRIAKLRLFRVPELLGVSFLLALLAVTSSFLLK